MGKRIKNETSIFDLLNPNETAKVFLFTFESPIMSLIADRVAQEPKIKRTNENLSLIHI